MKITVELPEEKLAEACAIAGMSKKGPAIGKLLADTLQARRRARIAGKFLSGQWSANFRFQLSLSSCVQTHSLDVSRFPNTPLLR